MYRLAVIADTAAAVIHAVAALLALYLIASLVLPGHGPVVGSIVLALAVTGADLILTWPLRRLAGAAVGR